MAPTSEQRLLLRAALLEGETGRQAWRRWRAGADIERLDTGSQRLLPQLYRNVRAFAAGDPLLERLKGVYRHAWSANGVLLHDTGRLLDALRRAHIRAVVLDGVSLVTRYYQDRGARAIDSISVMISPDDVPGAVRVLAEEGWEAPAPELPPDPGLYTSQLRLLGSKRPLDLLWDPFPEGCSPGIRHGFWADAEPAEVAGLAAQVLSPADELLRVCIRASRWEELPPFRRLADAMVLLRGSGARVDWARLCGRARQARVVLPVLASWSLLKDVLDAPIPAEALRQLRGEPVDAGEWLEQRLREGPRPRLGRLPDLLFRYRRLSASEGAPVAPGPAGPGFTGYLQGAWGVRRAWQLPLVALGKGVRRALRPISPSLPRATTSRPEPRPRARR